MKFRGLVCPSNYVSTAEYGKFDFLLDADQATPNAVKSASFAQVSQQD